MSQYSAVSLILSKGVIKVCPMYEDLLCPGYFKFSMEGYFVLFYFFKRGSHTVYLSVTSNGQSPASVQPCLAVNTSKNYHQYYCWTKN